MLEIPRKNPTDKNPLINGVFVYETARNAINQQTTETKETEKSNLDKVFDEMIEEILRLKNLNSDDEKMERRRLKIKYNPLKQSVREEQTDELKVQKRLMDIKYARQKEELVEAERRSVTDALSGLFTRGHFMKKLEEEFNRAKRYGNKFGVLMIDIDEFKSINDTLGHQGGDAAIKKLGEIIKKTCGRPTDIKGRYGGEEFAVILPETSNQGTMDVAEKLRVEIENQLKPHLTEKYGKKAESIMGTASIGVTTFDNQENPENIIKEADDALYTAKRTGKNKMLNAKELTPEDIKAAEEILLKGNPETVKKMEEQLPEDPNQRKADIELFIRRNTG